MNAPANLQYTKSDEWFDPDTGKAGITDYAQGQLSDIVFVEILVDEGEDRAAVECELDPHHEGRREPQGDRDRAERR